MASKKVSTLNALTTAGSDDLLYIADTSDSGSSYASKRITVGNFLNGYATTTELTDETNARTSADAALSGRLDTLEADPTTQTLLTAETTARTSADSALSGRLDVLEADPTTATALASESSTRASADTALSGRLDALEADPTTQTLLNAETTARTSADTALSGRLDTLEADPTTATEVTNAIAVETAARIAGDALKLDLAGGTMSGAINLGSSGAGTGVEYSALSAASFEAVNYATAVVSISDHASGIEIQKGSRDGWVARLPFNPTIGEENTVSYQIVGDGTVGAAVKANIVRVPDGVDASTSTWSSQYAIPNHLDLLGGDDYGEHSLKISGTYEQSGTFTFTPTDATGEYFIYFKLTGDDKFYIGDLGVTPVAPASAGSVLGVDGTATFAGNVTAAAVPTADAHLVNKLYADNLVAGVDLSGIATNASAIEALTNGAPELLNTLNELATAIGNDENFATTVTNQIATETTARTNADTALSGRLDTLEADPTTGAALTAETNARTSADSALSSRLDTLEADPTTQTLLDAETTARTNADTALSGRLDVLEADPTTQTLLNAETAARQAADALLLPLAGGTMSGAINLGAGSSVYTSNISVTAAEPLYSTSAVFDGNNSSLNGGASSQNFSFRDQNAAHYVSFEPLTVTSSLRLWVDTNTTGIDLNIDQGEANVVSFTENNGSVFNDPIGWVELPVTTPFTLTSVGRNYGNFGYMILGAIEVDGVIISEGATIGGGAASVLDVDGTATFGGNVTASAVPTTDDHLVNKLYADNLVAGVDLSGIATNAAAISAETTARTNADTALSGRLDTLEADPTTATALASEATTRANADTALSGRLDTLEADPTTATAVTNAIAVETAARQAADALLLPLAGGTMSGAIELGSVGGGNATATRSIPFVVDFGANYENITVSMTRSSDLISTVGTIYASDAPGPGSDHIAGSWGYFSNSIDGVNIDESELTSGNPFTPAKRWWMIGHNAFGSETLTIESTESFTAYDTAAGNTYTNPTVYGASSAGGTTISADGTATFGGNITASAVPTADDHLVNKLYADNLVAGVDLSGIATNAAAIQALTNGAPELLNTLQELAAALGDDANFSTTVTGQIAANEVHIDNMVNLTGVTKDSTHLGAFAGSTIGASSNIKTALQALETAVETPSTASQIQTVEQTANGTFHVTFVDSNNNAATAEQLFTDGGLTYNPFTDLLSGGSVDMTKFFFDGIEVTSTGTELNYLSGVTSSVQTQIDSKVASGANVNTLVGDTSAAAVPVDVNGADNYLFLVIDKSNGALTAIDKTFLEAE